MKNIARIIFCAMVLFAQSASASFPLPWSSTFNCTPWDGTYCTLSCDGMQCDGDWNDSCGNAEQVTAAANYPLGGGGLGQRHWVGPSLNSQSGGIRYEFNSGVTEFWVRFYMRFQVGFPPFSGSGCEKLLYFRDTGGTNFAYLLLCQERFDLYEQNGTTKHLIGYGGGFERWWGNPSNGSWHAVEVRMKIESAPAAEDGILQIWVDGTEVMNATNMNVGVRNRGTRLEGVLLPSNHGVVVGMSTCMYQDIDDIAFSATGYIGPLNQPPDTTPPVISAPLPSGAQTCTTDPQSTTLRVTTNENATCRYNLTDVAYASMSNTFTTTGGTDHSRSVSLGCNAAYNYYVRCIDPAGNANTSSASINFSVAAQSTAATLFSEGFNDQNFAGRSWFDDTAVSLDATTKYAGASSLKLTWTAGQTNPSLTGAMRRSFTATDELFVSMYWRFNTDWVGSGVAYHPHLVYVLSDLDDVWGGLAYNYLNTYIETSVLTPRLEIQDGRNVNQSLGAVPNNLTTTTENRDVSGCNGTLAGSDAGTTSCYSAGSGQYWNDRGFVGSQNFVRNAWHKVESYFKMNTIAGGIAQPDGIMRMWVDGVQVINNTHTVYRTNQRATINWRTLVIAPYIGDGSPQNQTMWIDELVVMAGMPNTAPAAPKSLRLGTGGAVGLGSGGAIALQ